MSAIVTIQGTVKSLQPIVHGADMPDEGVAAQGNERFHRKMKVWYEGKAVHIPVISGNSIRGIMRRLGAQTYLEMLELDPDRIGRKLHYLLFSGGSLETGAAKGRQKEKKEVNRPFVEDLREHIPLASLMGCSFKRQLISGKLIADFLVPIVDEVAELYGQPKPGIRAAEITDWLFYTRQDHSDAPKTERNQMIYKTEYIVPNMTFMHAFTLMGASSVETALFYHLLEELNRYGRVGGKIAQGHGKVEFHYSLEANRSADPYISYIEKNKNKILAFLQSNWSSGDS
ncbi:hypothetical protein [Paenibacillus sp. OV219]|uniref:hypothetical protein n=1 Tax=Paenibacillus sp. OV219 TaxID=1884377 RepID=UPI0008B614AC|nr:hypothetical protein [Paenibacillus sp. OV219]SEN04900.1 CRISPR type IV/AFERR-associated protein Csf2 [Paenibacillus sp. OV219]